MQSDSASYVFLVFFFISRTMTIIIVINTTAPQTATVIITDLFEKLDFVSLLPSSLLSLPGLVAGVV